MATRVITSRNYTPGERVVDFPTIAEKRFSDCKITLTRENWPGTTQDVVVTVIAERSEDGENWEQIGGAEMPGGVLTHPRTGQIVTESSVEFSFGGGDVPGDVRVRFINSMTLRTAVTAELTR